MSDISFNEDPSVAAMSTNSSSTSLTSMVKKLGLAKTDKEAERVLIGVAVVALLGAVFLLFGVAGQGEREIEQPPLPPGIR